MGNAQLEVISKGNSSLGFGIPKALLKYGVPIGLTVLAGYLLVKNAGGIAGFFGNAGSSIFGSIGNSINNSLKNFNDNLNKTLNNVTGNGTIQGNPQNGDTVYHITDGSGNTSVVKAGTPSTNPSFNLTDPITNKPINLGDFQNSFPDLYNAISTIKLPDSYNSDYISGKINSQPTSFGNTQGLDNLQQFQENVALGANPDTGEFDTGFYYINANEPRVGLTPYELNYYTTHGIKLRQVA